MKKVIQMVFTITISLSFFIAVGQKNDGYETHRLKIEIKNYEDSTLLLAQIYGDEITVIDTIHQSARKGIFKYSIPYGTPTGVYRIIADKKNNQSFDVVFNDSDIFVLTSASHLREQLQVIESIDTRLYHRHQRAEGYIRYKQSVIDQMLEKYPSNDPFYEKIENKYIRLQKERHDSAIAITSNYPDTFVAKIIKTGMVPVNKNLANRSGWENYRKKHFFDYTSLSDAGILRSQALPNKILDFLGLYRKTSYNKAQQQAEFSKAVDTLIKYTQGNAEIFDFTINFLIDGFRRYEFNQLVDHIASQTEEALKCLNSERRNAVKEKIQESQVATPGTKAPDIQLPGINGDTVRLKDFNGSMTLAVFWASWCPHCMRMLPELQKFYSQTDANLQVFAVSLDTDRDEWQKAAKKYPWTHVSDLKGWDSSAADKYQVYGTPSFFLLDGNRKVLVRSGSLTEIKRYIKKKPQD